MTTNELQQLALDIVARRRFVDPHCPEVFYLRVMSAVFEIQEFYCSEPDGHCEHLVSNFRKLLRDYAGLGIDEPIVQDFLQRNLFDLETRQEGTLLDRSSWRDVRPSDDARTVPAMLYPETMAYYVWLGRMLNWPGEIVDLGPWMGSSTFCLAEGLAANPNRNSRKIHAFDSFTWEGWMDYAVVGRTPCLKIGDSFRELFEKNTSLHADRIVTHSGALDGDQHFWSGESIAILIIDLSDDYETHAAIWQVLRPSLIPGRTIVVFNQFGNATAHAIRAFCRDHCEELAAVHKPFGSAKGFRYTQ